MADDDIDLNALNDEELVEQMWDDLYDGLADEIVEGVSILLARKWTPYDVLTKALAGLLGQQNGGPPADEVLVRLWDDDVLSFSALERLTQHLTEKAGSRPPA